MSNITSIADFYNHALTQIRAIKFTIHNLPDSAIQGAGTTSLHCLKCRLPLVMCHGPRTGFFLIHPHNDHCQNQFARFIHSRDRNEALQGANLTEDRCAENARAQGQQPGGGSRVSAQSPAGHAQPLP